MEERQELVEVTRQMLIDNWPTDPMEVLQLGITLDCNPGTLKLFIDGKTRYPRPQLCQRIYEHYTDKPLLSA